MRQPGSRPTGGIAILHSSLPRPAAVAEFAGALLSGSYHAVTDSMADSDRIVLHGTQKGMAPIWVK